VGAVWSARARSETAFMVVLGIRDAFVEPAVGAGRGPLVTAPQV